MELDSTNGMEIELRILGSNIVILQMIILILLLGLIAFKYQQKSGVFFVSKNDRDTSSPI